MIAHTPGPWRYVRTNGSPTTGQYMIAGAKPGYLAEIRDFGSGETEANAKLIAAAPLLYEAIQPFVSAASSEEFITITVRNSDIRKARFALRKAEGKS